MHGHETGSATWREERKLRVFENRVLRRIFGSKRDEITRERRKLHNDELHSLGNKIKNNEMDGVCSTLGDRRGEHAVLLG